MKRTRVWPYFWVEEEISAMSNKAKELHDQANKLMNYFTDLTERPSLETNEFARMRFTDVPKKPFKTMHARALFKLSLKYQAAAEELKVVISNLERLESIGNTIEIVDGICSAEARLERAREEIVGEKFHSNHRTKSPRDYNDLYALVVVENIFLKLNQ